MTLGNHFLLLTVRRLLCVVVLCTVCFSLSACVEGVDLPKLFTSLKDVGFASKDDVSEMGGKLAKVDSETLLAAKGNWNIVEQGRVIDPTLANELAREKVNIKRRKIKKELSAHFKPNAKSGEDGKMRVLRLECDGSPKGVGASEYALTESSVTKPSHTIVEGDLLKKIIALFGENDAGSKSISRSLKDKVGGEEEQESVSIVGGVVIPRHKPDRRSLAAASVAIGQKGHVLYGVVVPPPLPERKISDIGSAVLGRVKNADNSVVVRPRVKPVRYMGKRKSTATAKMRVRSDVIKIRSGKHKTKTRLLIEVSRPTKYKVAIDHVRGVLRVKLEDAHWTLPVQDRFSESKLLGTYIAREQSDGSVIFEVRLAKQSKIIDTMLLRPSLSSEHCIVIDLKD